MSADLTANDAQKTAEQIKLENEASKLMAQAKKRMEQNFLISFFQASGQSKYEDAADMIERASTKYKLAKAWSKAADGYLRLAEDVYARIGSAHEQGTNFVEAANCFKKIDSERAIECFKKAAKTFADIGRLAIAAKHLKECGDLLELKERKLEEAMKAFEAAADLYQSEEQQSTANQCKLRVAQIAGELGKYETAFETFEECARHAAENNLLKYSAKAYLLQAGICRLCFQDPVGVLNACERYKDIDPLFLNSREDELLRDLANASEQGDQDLFANKLGSYDDISRLDAWKTTLLLRAKKRINESGIMGNSSNNNNNNGGGGVLDEDDLT